jgi:hypothetical protein
MYEAKDKPQSFLDASASDRMEHCHGRAWQARHSATIDTIRTIHSASPSVNAI